MKRPTYLLLASIIILNLFAPFADAATDTYQPNLDEPGQCVHGSLAGDFDDYSWAVFIGNDQFDTAAGIRFPNITIDQGEIINDANLTVYYPGGFDWDTGTLYLMIYGYDSDNAPDDLTWSDIVNGPRTEALTVFNMSLMDTTDSYIIDVTDHVQEIVDRYNWESGNAIAFTTLHIIEEDEGEYWYEWASNTGAYKNHRPTLTIRHGETPTTGPGEGYDYNGTYQGHDIWFYNDTVNYWGLDNPNYWVNLPVTLQTQAGEVDKVNASTYDSGFIPNADYHELWPNDVYEGNQYKQHFHASALYDGEFGLSRCDATMDTNTKVNIFALERTWGTQTGNNATLGFIGGFSDAYSGSWLNRQSNNAQIVATRIRSYDSDTVQLDGDALFTTAEANGPVLYLDENKIYIMRYEVGFQPSNYGGSKYLYHYRNRFYNLNGTTGVVSYFGQVQYHFNISQARWDSIDRIELIECFGAGTTDASIELYVSRGFIPEKNYTSYYEIWKNGTKINDFPENSTLEDITDYIDDIGNTTDPDNPAAGSRWTGSEPWYLDRSRTQLYFTIFGLGFIIPPWIIAAHKRRIDIIVTALLLNILGIALLYGVSYI